MSADARGNRGTMTPLDDGTPSVTVVNTVADVEGTSFTELPPLYEAVDPDALDAMCAGDTSGRVTFEYHGYTVTVEANERVVVQK